VKVLTVRMFGSIEVQVGGRRHGVGDFGGRKPKQILEILLCERGHPVAKDRIADLLWGEALPKNPAATLETCPAGTTPSVRDSA